MMMDETRSDLPDSLTAQAASNSEPRLKTSSELRAAELRLEDLDIRVHTPLKHGDGLLDSHVVYTVTTKVCCCQLIMPKLMFCCTRQHDSNLMEAILMFIADTQILWSARLRSVAM
eukprot:TRINITY_DN8030_c0_g1_i5.p1 TRINITY_DN8030_c0_g1~~TRINITY_DN8030_c0_g1_i5.p1  ORF type:complete len:116 (+),score=4.84 TRINITY_DN8030_c0_g1_i5:82-429(+)